MTTGLFEPKGPGGVAYWRIVYEALEPLAPGDVIAYADLFRALETTNRGLVQRSVYRAARELRRTRKRDVAVVRNTGYRILKANEHVSKAELHKGRAERQLQVATEVVDSTDLGALTREERDQWGLIKRGMMLLYQAVKSQSAEIARHDQLITSLTNRVEVLESR